MTAMIFAASLAWAAGGNGKGKGESEMNGISHARFAGFEDQWKLITVRFRSDTREQRFVWANPEAVKALEAGAQDFPDGAVFAKIGFAVEEDPAFKSSLVPSGSKRYQFMVRDKERYKDTGGWGYALFDGQRLTYEGDHQSQARACYACHQLVPQRGDVFSVPLKISPFAGKPGKPEPEVEIETEAVKFATTPIDQVPAEVRKHLPRVKAIRSVQGPLRENVFRGTIDEIRPSLIEEFRRSKQPAALIATDRKQFAAIFAGPGRNECPKPKSFRSVFATEVKASEGGHYHVVATQDLCL